MQFSRLSLVITLGALILLAPGIRAQTGSKLSPELRLLDRSLSRMGSAKAGQEVRLPSLFEGAVSHLPGSGVQSAAGQEPRISVVVVHDGNPAALESAGFELGTVTARTAVVRVPHSRLGELETLPGILRAEVSLPLKPYLDRSRPDIGADTIHQTTEPPFANGGSGVVVGVVDSGIDFFHDDFKDESGNTRILAIWDQNDNAGSPGPPAEFPCTGGRSYCGTEWNQAAIQNGTARQRDFVGHGTHVTGIAAGDGSAHLSGTPTYEFRGIAPHADIVAVNTAFLTDAIIEGVDYIFRRAGKKAAVVNLSLGSQFGGHDGSTALDLALADLSGPGRVIVAAAGNEGDIDIHAEAVLDPGEEDTFTLVVGPRTPQDGPNNDYFWCDAWYPGDADIAFSLTSPGNRTVGPVGPDGLLETATPNEGTMVVDNSTVNTFSGDREACLLSIDENSSSIPSDGLWTITLKNNGSETAEVDIWMSFSTLVNGGGVADVFFFGNNVERAELVSSPASSDSVIGVGAYVTKRSWMAASGENIGYTSGAIELNKIAPFSSPGPRRDGVVKPDIAAPGIGIASTLAENLSGVTSRQIMMPDERHLIDQGTSQASPHVAGTVAMILENNPDYGFQEIMRALSATARQDGFTGPVPNSTWGYGKLDAAEAAGFTVPVRLLSLTAQVENGFPVIRWSLAENEPGTVFLVERGAAPSGPFTAVSERLTGDGPFTWIDEQPDADRTYYRVRNILRSGVTGFFGPVRVETVANRIQLWQNAPNPFATSTRMRFSLEREAAVRIEVLDIQGRLVRTLMEGTLAAGPGEVTWDGRGGDGRSSAGGVYFYRLSTPDAVQVKRLVHTP